jgi:uncharacterized protein YdaU (DUF1376 family)
MHYYKRNLGDYAKKAGRLSMLQHGSYTLLIDACYDREQFPTRDEAIDWTWASSTAEIEAVDFVLSKFFTLEDGRYVQKRIQEEIAAYHETSETNKRIAAEREAKRREASTNRARSVDEAPPNHKPLTINQEPEVRGETPRKRSGPTPAIAKPDDVDQQTWADWLSLRKAKKAPVTETVVNGARDESGKAGMTLDAFLQVWCLRGSQGLQADWLKPHELQTASRVQPMSFAQQDAAEKRQRWEQMTGRKWPDGDVYPECIDVSATPKNETLLVEQQGL